jgi:hypothetical protein
LPDDPAGEDRSTPEHTSMLNIWFCGHEGCELAGHHLQKREVFENEGMMFCGGLELIVAFL